jgi:hypothetical protein
MELMKLKLDNILKIIEILKNSPTEEIEINKFIRKNLQPYNDISTLKGVIGKLC